MAVWAFRTFRQPSDGVHDRVRVLPVVPVSPRENDAWRLRFEFPRDFLLICAVLPQNLSCQLIQVHVPLSPCRFGRFQRNTVGGYHQGLENMHDSFVQVDVVPRQRQSLSTPHSRERDEVDERREGIPLISRQFQQAQDLIQLGTSRLLPLADWAEKPMPLGSL